MPTAEQDAYLLKAFGIDPRQYTVATAGLVTDTLNPSTSPPAAPPDAGQPPAASPPDASPPAAPPPAAPPPVPIVLTHKTVASSPSSVTRTKLGVGEQVVLTVAPGPGKWLVSGGKLSSGQGAKVVLYAPGSPGTVDVSVDVNGQKAAVRFTVIAPDSIHMDVAGTSLPGGAGPNGIVQLNVYAGPSDVSFMNIKLREQDVPASAHGYWAAADGHGHGPNPNPVAMRQTVVSGKGTLLSLPDNAGIWGGSGNPPWEGDCVYQIPWEYSVGTGAGTVFTTVKQSMVNSADGTLTISKGGASHSFPLATP
jgi:hypothetical protein